MINFSMMFDVIVEIENWEQFWKFETVRIKYFAADGL